MDTLFEPEQEPERDEPRAEPPPVSGDAEGALADAADRYLVRAKQLGFDAAAHRDTAPWPRVAREFAAAVRAGRPHELDARHGLRLQELIDRAERSLRAA